MLTLLVFPPAMGLISPSPFSMKAIALLQMSGLNYEIKPGDPRKAPKEKLPVLMDGTKAIPDSCHIQAYLENTKGAEFDIDLSPEQMAISQAFRCLIEDHLYWAMVYNRWIENSDITREEFFGMIPGPMRKIIFGSILKKVNSSLKHQGFGRHSSEDIYAFGIADIRAVADYLGEKQFFFGDKASSVDATIFAGMFNILTPAMASPLKTELKSHANLLAYCNRFIEKFDIPTV